MSINSFGFKILLALCAIGASFTVVSPSHAQASIVETSEPVRASLLHEDETIQPGRAFWVAVHLTLDKGWHTYWKNPGETGMGPQIKWTLPEGFRVDAVHWPIPEKMSLNSGIGFGYDNEVVLLARIVPTLSVNNPVEIGAQVRWVACDDSSCLPGGTKLSVSIPVYTETPKPHSEFTTIFSRGRKALPETDATRIRAARHGKDSFVLELDSSRKIAHAEFFPEESDQIDFSKSPSLIKDQANPNKYKIVLKEQQNNTHKPILKGVLVLREADSPREIAEAYEINHPIENDPANETAMAFLNKETSLSPALGIPVTSTEEGGGFWLALGFAFLGGLILNLMPCVLPVISFKLLNFVKLSGKNRPLIFKHGLAFSSGVLISFWLLAGMLLAFQAYGHAAGWGFQLQKPLFVGLLAAVFLIFGLSLFGFFEFGLGLASLAGRAQSTQSSQHAQGLSSSFCSGILATAVASPCTGPFLGTAMGLAFTMPAPLTLLIFTSLALGMSFPYLLVGAFPNLLGYLPKPGNWMVAFKQAMGFLMLATVIWLLRVFGAQTGNTGMVLILSGFLLLSVACWIYGEWGTPLSNKLTRRISSIFVIAFFIVGCAFVYNASSQRHEEMVASAKGWEPFSRERVQQLREKGIPVFIDFTAKWCATCEANHLILSTSSVEQKFTELGVVKMKADWTNEDPVIAEELHKFGRKSLPLYVLYTNNPANPPVILPQILTPDIVINNLKTAIRPQHAITRVD